MTIYAYTALSYIFKPHASSFEHLPLPSLALRPLPERTTGPPVLQRQNLACLDGTNTEALDRGTSWSAQDSSHTPAPSWRSTRRVGSLSRPGPDLVPEGSWSPSSCLKCHLLSSSHYECGLYFYLCSSHLWLQLVAHLCVSWGPLVRLLTSQHRHDQISVPNSFGLRWPEKFRLFSSDC